VGDLIEVTGCDGVSTARRRQRLWRPSIQPLDRRFSYRSCQARDVVAHDESKRDHAGGHNRSPVEPARGARDRPGGACSGLATHAGRLAAPSEPQIAQAEVIVRPAAKFSLWGESLSADRSRRVTQRHEEVARPPQRTHSARRTRRDGVHVLANRPRAARSRRHSPSTTPCASRRRRPVVGPGNNKTKRLSDTDCVRTSADPGRRLIPCEAWRMSRSLTASRLRPR
jgi:hypothetical protein